MQNAGLDEALAGSKIARRNINNLKYADDTTLTAESEELKSLLMKVKQVSEKAGLKLQHSKNLRSWHPVPHFMANRWGNNGNSETDFILGGSKITMMVIAAMKSKDACSLEEKL